MNMYRITHLALVLMVVLLAGCTQGVTDPADDAAGSARYITSGCRTVQGMVDWARANPRPTTGEASWDQMCGSFMVRSGNLQTSRSSAYLVAMASGWLNPNYAAAPAGAFHYWSIGAYGHVGCDLSGGGYNVLMATYKLRESWGNAMGLNSVSGYNAATGARYLGWAANYCGSQLNSYGVPWVTSNGLPKTTTEWDGVPGTVFWKRMQYWAKLYGGYTGPIDGVMGKNSWMGVQRNLAREYGYTGPIDGVPGSNTYKAMQRWAARYGYTGPIDGVLGPNAYRAIAKALNTL